MIITISTEATALGPTTDLGFLLHKHPDRLQSFERDPTPRGRIAVVDATNAQPDARKALVALAREHDVLPVAIVLDVPVGECARRNAERRIVPSVVV